MLENFNCINIPKYLVIMMFNQIRHGYIYLYCILQDKQ